nr:anhydro-N-acetylmuramic acid kinase [Actinosynnema mirum]
MRVIGLHSGTSADAVDVAVADLSLDGPVVVLSPVEHAEHPFPERLRAVPTGAGDVCALDTGLGQLFGRIAAGYRGDLVSSLGQTAHHRVENGTCLGTLQLGEPAWIAEATGLPVVSGFRQRDVAAGGHGAPLASALDVLWLAELSRTAPAAALNLGGIANVTLVRRGHPPSACDTGPGNALLDAAAQRITGTPCDVDGALALRGAVHPGLLDRLLADPHYARPAPKSTGKEHFNAGHLDRATEGLALTPEDLLATLVELTARTAARACADARLVVVSGGGTRNPALMAALRRHLPGSDVRPSDDLGLPAGAKEAHLTALLGFLAWHGLPGNVPAATGARGPRPLGSITPGRAPLRLPEPATTPVTGLRIGGSRART